MFTRNLVMFRAKDVYFDKIKKLSLSVSFQFSGKAGSYSQLMLKTETSEQLLCTLVHGTIFQQCLDLKLMPGEKVTFTVQGSCKKVSMYSAKSTQLFSFLSYFHEYSLLCISCFLVSVD